MHQKSAQVKYLNNSVENDQKSTKSKSRYQQWYQSFDTAKNTIDGIESMRMIQKGQIKNIAVGNVYSQNEFLSKLFNLAA